MLHSFTSPNKNVTQWNSSAKFFWKSLPSLWHEFDSSTLIEDSKGSGMKSEKKSKFGSHYYIFLKSTGLVEHHSWSVFSIMKINIIFNVNTTGDGRKLADVGLDDDHCICIWDWKKEEKLASTRGHKDMIFVLEWNPFNSNYLVSVGEKHIKFWTQKGKTF